MPKFPYGTSAIEYSIQYVPNKKDVSITVDWTSGVSVTVPDNISQERIDLVLRQKAPWILRRLSEFNEIKPLTTRHEFISGEKFPYLGRQYRLKVAATDSTSDVILAFQNGKFIASVPKSSSPTWRQEQLRIAFRDWYMKQGHSKVQQRIKLFAPRLGLTPSKTVMKDQQSRWGSCTKNGTININWRILMAPMRIVDYVIVHELGHMIHADHSSDFWTVVASVMPDYDERKDWLRVHGPTLQL